MNVPVYRLLSIMDDEKTKRIAQAVERLKLKAQQPRNPIVDFEPFPKLSGYIDSWWVPLAVALTSCLIIYAVILMFVLR